MPMKKADKHALADEYGELVDQSPSLLVFDYRGLTVDEISDLRNKVREAEATMRVVKNRMLKRAIDDKPYRDMQEILIGPSAVIFSGEDPVKPAKALMDFAKDHEDVKVKGGMISESFIDISGVERLSKTPSLEEIHAMILGGIKAPASNILGGIKGLHQKLFGLINAYKDKLEETA